MAPLNSPSSSSARSHFSGNKFSFCHAGLLVAMVWCYAGVFAVGPLSGWGEYGPEPYGTACCINWHAPSQSTAAMTYIICLFFFCYIVPCTVIFLSYTFILLTVRGSRQAVQQHMSPQNKITNAHALIIKVTACCILSLSNLFTSTHVLYMINIHSVCVVVSFQLSVAVCIGFLTAWSPYAVVSMWAGFGNPASVPPMAFALAAIFAKSSTLYNPIVYLVFKPNFRKSLCRDVAQCRRTLCGSPCQHSSAQKGTCGQPNHKEDCNLTRLSNGLPENHRTCRHCPCPETVLGDRETLTDTNSPQKTARILKGSLHNEVAISQLSNEVQSDFL